MTGGQPKPVVVGIIDDGIAFAHERFRSGDKSRVRFVWLQDGVHQGPKSRVDYGRELWNDGVRKDIDTMLDACRHAGVVDEDEFYLRAGLFDFRRPGHKAATWRTAHGTHVMDVACGFDPAERRDDIPIVCVQLPARTTANTSGGDLTPYAVDALWYIRDRADEIGRSLGQHPLPVVINFSYGMIGGPHDGTSELEILIDELIEERMRLQGVPLQVVLPAGNSRLSRCHAEVSFKPTEPEGNIARLQWRVLPDDLTPSFLDIWLPDRADGKSASRLSVTVTPPGGYESPPLGESPNSMLEWRPNGKLLCALQYNHYPPPTGRGRFRITLRPTADLRAAAAIAPAGIWTVTLRNALLEPDKLVQVWIQRDESLYGYPRRGRQSRFENERRPDDPGFGANGDDAAALAQRAGLINAIGTGHKSIVMGGFVRKDLSPADYSAGGPITKPAGARQAHRDGPDAMTVSEDSRVHAGVLAAGSRSGAVVAMGGTSVAAPAMTREIVERLAGQDRGDREAVKDIAQRQENTRPSDAKRPPRQRGGWGRIALRPVVRLPRFWGM